MESTQPITRNDFQSLSTEIKCEIRESVLLITIHRYYNITAISNCSSVTSLILNIILQYSSYLFHMRTGTREDSSLDHFQKESCSQPKK
mmetsp:Transcript_25189/g.34636  ORF Transcript_25189/g.34636 Transcript_25189/m.34636 type:complete len:89 (+) Transcript_25189:302-568(+)